MPLGRLREILEAARAGGYAVPALNVVDLASMTAVVRAAGDCRSPIIVQAAARVARWYGPATLAGAFGALAASTPVPMVLGLDHCADVEFVMSCLDAGWGTVLFDGSGLPIEENERQTRLIVERAHIRDAAVEGELEAIQGVEDGATSGKAFFLPVSSSAEFVAGTGIDCFAPSIGNVHGRTANAPELDLARAAAIAAAVPVPLALHGGTGIAGTQLHTLMGMGFAKLNVSTALREAYLGGVRDRLASDPDLDDPVVLLMAAEAAVAAAVADVMRACGSAGRA